MSWRVNWMRTTSGGTSYLRTFNIHPSTYWNNYRSRLDAIPGDDLQQSNCYDTLPETRLFLNLLGALTFPVALLIFAFTEAYSWLKFLGTYVSLARLSAPNSQVLRSVAMSPQAVIRCQRGLISVDSRVWQDGQILILSWKRFVPKLIVRPMGNGLPLH
ncbi:hypothetical protein B0H16DRAFT_1467725 [Mycena metata]|uniref:Uncharacterized protein n=1 Tax=Mycena metata TaxID=1033252 RepID=A0AAD7MVN8_9AGAR|nr:hypothetical protein B0H16DRAFT_1467725 [Mycena metata]